MLSCLLMRRFLSSTMALLLLALSGWGLAGIGEWWAPHPTVIVAVVSLGIMGFVWLWDEARGY